MLDELPKSYLISEKAMEYKAIVALELAEIAIEELRKELKELQQNMPPDTEASFSTP